MELEKKLELLADVMDLEVAELKKYINAPLADLDGWDSVAVLSFIVMLDEKFGKSIKGEDVRALVTVQDALNLMNKD
ncbi:MAG: acyl carrier protein [Synergistaceae bacterium]|nr:acyl carrier protein [Synergistaceae bacterium]MBQ3626826.1 acyl carrier protein [Synergistaceae bacterium]MBQ7570013.1 acyl carrier protein [Synergistaceae bacterium]MBQ9582583.1 acyl carrier protein [Synergistaceae bacterium]MBQ9895989.1 acyl carrier protein [Synergistaceae bacterium]